LDVVLLRLSDTLEKQVELRNKVRSAMTYPIMVALMVFVILTAILVFIVPTLGLGAYALKKYIGTVNGRKQLDRFKLRVPIFGELFRKVAIARMSRTL